MIKQNWNISQSEKKRILELHESATKNMYLIKEQIDQEIDFSIPKNIKFNFPLNRLGQRGDLDARTDDQGNVYVIWDEDERKLPSVQEIGLPKFKPNNEGLLEAVDEWEWLNSFNYDMVKNTPQEPKFYIPSYGKSDSSLHFLFYEFVEVSGRGKKSRTQSNDFLQAGDGKYMNFDDVSLIVVGDDLPTSDRIPQPSQPVTPKPPKEISLELNISDPFIFDQVILTPEGQKAFDKFVEDLRKNINLYSGDVEVITSASIDAKPETKATYNMNLSRRRANAIIDQLKTKLGQTNLNFIAKPLGQTDQFAPGLKFPEVRDTNRTAPNRRLIINLPKVTVKQ